MWGLFFYRVHGFNCMKRCLKHSQPICLSVYFSTLGYFIHPQSGYLVLNGITTTSETHNDFFLCPLFKPTIVACKPLYKSNVVNAGLSSFTY